MLTESIVARTYTLYFWTSYELYDFNITEALETLPRRLPFTSSRLNPAFLDTAGAQAGCLEYSCKDLGHFLTFQRERECVQKKKNVPKKPV